MSSVNKPKLSLAFGKKTVVQRKRLPSDLCDDEWNSFVKFPTSPVIGCHSSTKRQSTVSGCHSSTKRQSPVIGCHSSTKRQSPVIGCHSSTKRRITLMLDNAHSTLSESLVNRKDRQFKKFDRRLSLDNRILRTSNDPSFSLDVSISSVESDKDENSAFSQTVLNTPIYSQSDSSQQSQTSNRLVCKTPEKRTSFCHKETSKSSDSIKTSKFIKNGLAERLALLIKRKTSENFIKKHQQRTSLLASNSKEVSTTERLVVHDLISEFGFTRLMCHSTEPDRQPIIILLSKFSSNTKQDIRVGLVLSVLSVEVGSGMTWNQSTVLFDPPIECENEDNSLSTALTWRKLEDIEYRPPQQPSIDGPYSEIRHDLESTNDPYSNGTNSSLPRKEELGSNSVLILRKLEFWEDGKIRKCCLCAHYKRGFGFLYLAKQQYEEVEEFAIYDISKILNLPDCRQSISAANSFVQEVQSSFTHDSQDKIYEFRSSIVSLWDIAGIRRSECQFGTFHLHALGFLDQRVPVPYVNSLNVGRRHFLVGFLLVQDLRVPHYLYVLPPRNNRAERIKCSEEAHLPASFKSLSLVRFQDMLMTKELSEFDRFSQLIVLSQSNKTREVDIRPIRLSSMRILSSLQRFNIVKFTGNIVSICSDQSYSWPVCKLCLSGNLRKISFLYECDRCLHKQSTPQQKYNIEVDVALSLSGHDKKHNLIRLLMHHKTLSLLIDQDISQITTGVEMTQIVGCSLPDCLAIVTSLRSHEQLVGSFDSTYLTLLEFRCDYG